MPKQALHSGNEVYKVRKSTSMKSSEIRQKFLNFFDSKDHKIVDSAPIVIKNDPTLMFTNAGMNQFKDIFLENESADYPRIADTQKCLRVSGKHNDLEEVGVDTYHHTMFEMLGNWSFGNYYKKEAISWAWELLTDVYGIDKDRIFVTVFAGDKQDGLEFDQEAYDIWKDLVDEDRIIGGDKKDNFWEMGDVGPCGPASEIHVDTRSDEDRKKVDGKTLVNQDHPEVIEIWNLVFMEMQRKASGELVSLSHKHIDTGMGLERLAMVLQGKQSTYDTDIFQALIGYIEKVTGKKYSGSTSKQDVAIRVMADHIRAVSFAIADGQMPSNTGAGYVLRRILRRAVRYAYSFLDVRESILQGLASTLIQEMGGFFTQLKSDRKIIEQVIHEEEESFLKTLSKGIERIDEIIEKTERREISGKVVFELYDTFGFPADLTALILAEHDKHYNHEEFIEELEAQKSRSRQDAATDKEDWVVLKKETGPTEFKGYDRTEIDVELVRYRKVSQKGKDLFQLVFDQTPFYPEGGGQVGDKGVLIQGDEKLPIINTQRENNLIVHTTKKSPEGLNREFRAIVAKEKRALTANNHSATHLLHHALRHVLGTHVEQRGSLVESDYLRFDFSHFTKVGDEEIRAIEKQVNEMIRKNINLEEFRAIPMDEAKTMGALALFGEKYGDKVRVIKFGDSIELCGGTHVQGTGQIGFFKIISEGSVAAGIRRVEAITAEAAEKFIFEQVDTLNEIKSMLKSPAKPIKSVQSLIEEQHKLSREIEALKREQSGNVKDNLIKSAELIDGVNFIAQKVDLDAGQIKDLAFQLRNEVSPLFMVLASDQNSKATLSVALSDDLSDRYNSNKIVKELASFIKGGGGGQAFFATAGGKNPAGIDEALTRARQLLSES